MNKETEGEEGKNERKQMVSMVPSKKGRGEREREGWPDERKGTLGPRARRGHR